MDRTELTVYILLLTLSCLLAEDIEYFKKVELKTKLNRRGRILEPLGETQLYIVEITVNHPDPRHLENQVAYFITNTDVSPINLPSMRRLRFSHSIRG
jgi:hypothetical protein